jgi:hypothetical protein
MDVGLTVLQMVVPTHGGHNMDEKLGPVSVEEAVAKTFATPEASKAFWHAQTPHFRLCCLELMRSIAYGYDVNSPPKMVKILEYGSIEDFENGTQTRFASGDQARDRRNPVPDG